MHINAEQLHRLRPAIQSGEWFSQCPQSLQDGLLSMAVVDCIPDGEVLFESMQLANGLYCILAGSVRIHHTRKEKSVLIVDHKPYEWLGEVSHIDNEPDGITATARGETTVIHIPRAPLLRWLHEHPEHWQELAKLVCRRFRYMALMLVYATTLSLEERILERLHLISTSYGMRKNPAHRIYCSQDELASMVGASRPSVTTTLGKLSQQGLLELRYGQIYLTAVYRPKLDHGIAKNDWVGKPRTSKTKRHLVVNKVVVATPSVEASLELQLKVA